MKKTLVILLIALSAGITAHTQIIFNNVYNDFSYTYFRQNDGLYYYNNESFSTTINTIDSNFLAVGGVESNDILGDSTYIYIYIYIYRKQPPMAIHYGLIE